MVEFGAGMFLFAFFKLAVLESLLPNGTSQCGPPLCSIHHENFFRWFWKKVLAWLKYKYLQIQMKHCRKKKVPSCLLVQ